VGIDRHVQQFQQDGYCLAPGVFGADTMSELDAAFDRVIQQLATSGKETNARRVAALHECRTYRCPA